MPSPLPRTLGRFRIRSLLGEGAQGRVYLADDSHLDRQVAIKTISASAVTTFSAAQLIDEARAVGKLSHANVVTLYDAGEQGGVPYLVFEYVEGKTLEDRLRREKQLPIPEAVEIAAQLLDGIASAHAQGILHRDIKPGNVIFNAGGVPRLADFGVALAVGQFTGGFAGTPRYAAPEYLAGQAYQQTSDVFSASAVLYEMLTGKPALVGETLKEIARFASVGVITPPSRHRKEADERLDAILMRGLALRPEDRYPGAAEMAVALREYLKPSTTTVAGAGGTIEFLLRRMQHRPEFPALSETMRTINRIAASDNESASVLASAILKDFALTNRLLKVVNSAIYGNAGKVNTVSRAVVILGFDAVRSLAVTLLFIERMQNKGQAKLLQEELVGALFRGALTRDIIGRLQPRDREQAYLCGVYQSLGRVLVHYYFHDEALEILRRMQQEGVTEAKAAVAVLGVNFMDLARAIMSTWGFPSAMVAGMRQLPEGAPPAPGSNEERIWLAAHMAEEIRQAMVQAGPDDKDKKPWLRIGKRFAKVLPIPESDMGEIVHGAVNSFVEEARLVGIDTGNSKLVKQARQKSAPEVAAEQGADQFASTQVLESPDSTNISEQAVDTASCAAILTAGIQDITESLVGDFRLNDVLDMVIETMYRAMGFSQILFAVRHAQNGTIQGRFGIGRDIEEAKRNFVVTLNAKNDLFAAAARQGRDVFVANAGTPEMRQRLPEWYLRHFAAASFVLFPLVVDKKPFGLIYGGDDKAGRREIARNEANLLLTLRNQAVLAIRQHALR